MIPVRWLYAASPGAGYWGVPHSKMNFCEEDYIITTYIAEFINTLTNSTYVIYGIHGLRRTLSRPDGRLISTLALPYWGLISVGLLSAWFHAVLSYHSQMGDDLSMFLAVGTVLHQLFTFDASPSRRRLVTILILGAVVPASVYHVWTNEKLLHELVFGAMVVLCGRKTRWLIKERFADARVRKKLGRLASLASASGLFGYFLWNIDVYLCTYVTRFKHAIGLPWGFLFELHGWWHIFTGIGAYIGMALVEFIVTGPDQRMNPVEKGFVWPVRAVLDDIDDKEGKGKKVQ